jgi:riboflavin kinase/FMN adenylyltransferase
MKVVTSLDALGGQGPAVVSIGNFDGLHLGHQRILATVVKRARDLGLRSVAMTFSPHPIRFLAPDRAPRMISTLDQKVRLIESAGIDVLFIASFDLDFSRLSPEEFIQRYLIDGLQARSVCVGGNFNFGYRQRGSVETLRQFQSNFEIVEVPSVAVRGTTVSSSRIRQLVNAGSVSRAGRMLGHWIEIEGKIVSGAGRGRTMKVPTLNLEPDNELIPGRGVYVTRIALDGGQFLSAVTNIGIRPTFNETALTIETFVLSGNVPDEVSTARLDFLHRLRDERKFDSPDQLRSQIAVDVRRAQRFFRAVPGTGVHIDIYSRPGCHLCDDAKEIIERVQARFPFSLRVINIETDPALEKAYGEQIPVVFINSNKAFKYHVDENELEQKVKRLWKT